MDLFNSFVAKYVKKHEGTVDINTIQENMKRITEGLKANRYQDTSIFDFTSNTNGEVTKEDLTNLINTTSGQELDQEVEMLYDILNQDDSDTLTSDELEPLKSKVGNHAGQVTNSSIWRKLSVNPDRVIKQLQADGVTSKKGVSKKDSVDENSLPVQTKGKSEKTSNEKENKPELKLLGSGTYEADGVNRAEDAFKDDKILSKDAKTLPKDEQIEILKKAGINIDDFEACESDDGSISFKSKDGTKFYRVVNHNGEAKIIETNMKGTKASTKVYKADTDNSKAKETEGDDKKTKDKDKTEETEETDKTDKTDKKEGAKTEKTDKAGKAEKSDKTGKADKADKAEEPDKSNMKTKTNIKRCVEELHDSMSLMKFTSSDVKSVLDDEDISDNDIVQIIKMYEQKYGFEKNEDSSILSDIKFYASTFKHEELFSKLGERLARAANSGNEDAITLIAKESYFSTKDIGTCDGFLESVFNNLSTDNIAKVSVRYEQVNDGKNLFEDVNNDYWIPGRDNGILDKIKKGMRRVVD